MAIKRASTGGRSLVYFSALGFGLAPSSPECQVICGTVRSPAELPDPPDGCDFYERRDARGNEVFSALYEYHEGRGWHFHADTFIVSDGTRFINAVYDNIDGWSSDINGTICTGAGEIIFDNGVTEIIITYFSDSGCSYTIDPFTL